VIGENTLRISHKYKFIFFPIPKTGSKSLSEYLNPVSDIISVLYKDITPDFPFYYHMTPIELKKHFDYRGWDFDSYFKFTLVKNPWKRIASSYNMIRSMYPQFNIPFDIWLNNDPELYANGFNNVWMKHLNSTVNEYTGGMIDEVFKMEDFDIIPDMLIERGIPVSGSIPHINITPIQIPYKELYDEKTIDIVAKKHYNDIIKYGYTYK